jgi:hypothetical protein
VLATTAGDDQDDEYEDHEERDDPEHLDPARGAGRFAVGPHVGVVAGVGVWRRVSDVSVLLCRRAWPE